MKTYFFSRLWRQPCFAATLVRGRLVAGLLVLLFTVLDRSPALALDRMDWACQANDPAIAWLSSASFREFCSL